MTTLHKVGWRMNGVLHVSGLEELRVLHVQGLEGLDRFREHPCDVELHNHLGALEDFDRAHEVLKSRGNFKVALHDHQGALEDFDRAHELFPWDVVVLRSRGNVKVALHDHRGALEDFNRAHELDPCDVVVLRSRGNVKVALHDHRGAFEDFDTAHELDPFDVETLRLRGHVKRMMGDLKGSIMDWAMAHGFPYDDIVCFGNRAFVKRRLENYDGVVGELNHKQEFDFLLSLKKLILQLVVFFVVIVIFVFEYLMGYVERGQWGTYSNGTWEFRATYVCIELRLGSYPFQKFRERPPSRSYIGIHPRKKGKNREYTMYEPRLTVNKVRYHFPECKTLVKAAFIYDIAKLCLGVKDGHLNMLCQKSYDHLPKFPVEGLKEKSMEQIKKFVCECAKSTLRYIKDHPTDDDNQKILKLFEDGGEGCAMNERLASLESNGGDEHATPFNAGEGCAMNERLASLESNGGDEHATPFTAGEVCAMNENLASLDSNGGDDHSTRFSMILSDLEAVLNSPNDGDVPAIDIEHAQNRGESIGILENDIQYPNLPNWSSESPRIQSPTEICYSRFQFRARPGLRTSALEIQTKLRTFVKQNWKVALFKDEPFTSLNTVHQTVLQCSETSPLYLHVHKSGDTDSISLSAEMFSELEVLCGCGWTEG